VKITVTGLDVMLTPDNVEQFWELILSSIDPVLSGMLSNAKIRFDSGIHIQFPNHQPESRAYCEKRRNEIELACKLAGSQVAVVFEPCAPQPKTEKLRTLANNIPLVQRAETVLGATVIRVAVDDGSRRVEMTERWRALASKLRLGLLHIITHDNDFVYDYKIYCEECPECEGLNWVNEQR